MDNTSIGTAITEALTNVSNTENSLEEENDLLRKLYKEPDVVIEEVIASTAHTEDHKSVSTNMLGKI